MGILLKNGRILDPANEIDFIGDVLIKDRLIKNIAENIEEDAAQIIDCSGKWIIPGVVDLNVHLSEPKRYDRETVKTLTAACNVGGVTTALIRPSEDLIIDDVTAVEFIYSRNRKFGGVQMLPVAAATHGMNGERLTEFGDLTEAGAVAVGDEGRSVMSSAVMRRALEYARDFNLPVFSFPQDNDLANGGYMNEGAVSSLLGLKGMPYSAEEVIVTRDIILSRMTNWHVHISPITTSGSVELVRRAKSDGINVTCDTAPHYFALNENAVEGYNTNAKVSPPLRRERDLASIIEGIRDGTIDAIASAHKPLSIIDKDTAFAAAEFGISGVELLLPLCYTKLVETKKLSPLKMVAMLTSKPAELVGIRSGTLSEGTTADICVVDIETDNKIDITSLVSRGKNTPFIGDTLRGTPSAVIFDGDTVL